MSDITLYSLAPIDRGARVRWLYEELGIEYQQVWMDPQNNEHMGDAYRRVNPFAKVPGVQRDGEAFFESGAIIFDTLERMPGNRLAPAPGEPDRAEFLKWFMWGYQTLEAVVLTYYRNHDKPQDDPMRQEAVLQMERMLGPLNQQLRGRDYLLGDFTVADIVVGYDLALAKMRRYPLENYPDVVAYVDRLARRPAARSLFEAVGQQ